MDVANEWRVCGDVAQVSAGIVDNGWIEFEQPQMRTVKTLIGDTIRLIRPEEENSLRNERRKRCGILNEFRMDPRVGRVTGFAHRQQLQVIHCLSDPRHLPSFQREC